MDNKKQRFKIVISRKSNGKIHGFVRDCDVLAVCPVNPPVPCMAEYIVTFEDRIDTLLCSYRVVAENGIKAIDAAISDFKNDYHHGDVDVVGLVRCKRCEKG